MYICVCNTQFTYKLVSVCNNQYVNKEFLIVFEIKTSRQTIVVRGIVIYSNHKGNKLWLLGQNRCLFPRYYPNLKPDTTYVFILFIFFLLFVLSLSNSECSSSLIAFVSSYPHCLFFFHSFYWFLLILPLIHCIRFFFIAPPLRSASLHCCRRCLCKFFLTSLLILPLSFLSYFSSILLLAHYSFFNWFTV